jgi:hypothetical protein
MLTLGDVLAIVASLTLICVSMWALVMGVSVLFPDRVARARDTLILRPWRTFWVGLLSTFIGVTFGIAMINLPNPLIKILGTALLLAVLAVGAMGAGGLAQVAAERVQQLDEKLSAYQAQSRGALFIIVSGLVPFLGWFLVAPIVLILGIGAGTQVLRGRRVVNFEVSR